MDNFDYACGTIKSILGDFLKEASGSNPVQMDHNWLVNLEMNLLRILAVSARNVELMSEEMSNFDVNQEEGGVIGMDMSSRALLHSWRS